MSSNSPAPAPFMSMSMMDWDESAVQAWLAKVGLGQYEEVIYGECWMCEIVTKAFLVAGLVGMDRTCSLGTFLGWDVRRISGTGGRIISPNTSMVVVAQ